MVVEVRQSHEERHANMRLDDVYDAYKEATQAGRWSKEKECFVDPQGNPTVDPEKVEEGIRKVIYVSLEKKKKTVEEIVDESEKLVKEVNKEDEKSEEAVEEKQQVFEEIQNQQAKEATLPNIEVTIQTDSSIQSIDNETEYQCKKCMETCTACI
ncbi:hypothetical protein Hanom_Chr16g01439951 [Helianthus anomalus]